jgi:hypothetical protein
MHRSRLYGVFLDVPRARGAEAVEFWADAFGVAPRHSGDPTDPFTELPGVIGGGMVLEVQAVDDAPRFHLDIETDNVAAETARLIKLGATEVTRHEGLVVLRAPGGHLFCVVPVQSRPEEFREVAQTWH